MTLPEIAQIFIRRARTTLGLAKLTVDRYREDLTKYFTFLDSRGKTYREVTRDDIDLFTDALSNTMAPRSMHRPLCAVRTFYTWLNRTDRMTNAVADWVDLPRYARNLPIPLTEKEAVAVLEVAETNPLNKDWLPKIQDVVILRLLYATAMRLGEVAALKVQDFDWDAGTIVVTKGKGGKTRVVHVDQKTQHLVRRLISYGQRKASDFLIHNPRSERNEVAVRSYIERVVRVYAAKAGIKKRVYPHLFRHSCATHMLENGSDIKAIQTMLGHDNLSTTQVYLHMSDEHLKKNYTKSHPLMKASA